MIDREDLESFPTDRLSEQAIGFAKATGDLDWLWSLLRSIPATMHRSPVPSFVS